MVVQKKTLLVNNAETDKTVNNHFSETAEKSNTFKWSSNEKYENINDEKLTSKFKKIENHPSIMKIKSKYTLQETFSVKPVTVKDENVIENIPNNKVSGGEIPLNILKQSRFTYKLLTDCINDATVGEKIVLNLATLHQCTKRTRKN